jgi:heptosyltransferase-3
MITSRERPRVLLVRAGGLGDLLLLRGAIASLRGAGLSAWLLAPRPSAQALLGPGEADGLIDWEDPALARLWGGDRAGSPTAPAAVRGFAAAVAYTRAADLVEGLRAWVPRVIVHPPAPAEGHHAADWYSAPVAALAGRMRKADPCLAAPEEQRHAEEILSALPDRFLAVHPGSGSPAKNWPGFTDLVRMAGAGEPWLLVQGPADATACEPLARLPGMRPARALPIRVLGAVLARAGAYVGNDSGISHLAAAWGAPTLSLFGATDPRIWGPTGAFVESLRAPGGDLAALPPETVFEALTRLRAAKRGPAAGADRAGTRSR